MHEDKCWPCILAHLGAGAVLAADAAVGEEIWRWLVVGHLLVAEMRAVDASLDITLTLRGHRLALMLDDEYIVPWVKLIEDINGRRHTQSDADDLLNRARGGANR